MILAVTWAIRAPAPKVVEDVPPKGILSDNTMYSQVTASNLQLVVSDAQMIEISGDLSSVKESGHYDVWAALLARYSSLSLVALSSNTCVHVSIIV